MDGCRGESESDPPKRASSGNASMGVGSRSRLATFPRSHRLFPCSGSKRCSPSTSIRPRFWRREWFALVRRPANRGNVGREVPVETESSRFALPYPFETSRTAYLLQNCVRMKLIEMSRLTVRGTRAFGWEPVRSGARMRISSRVQ